MTKLQQVATRKRKRRRTQYVLLDWAPFVDELRLPGGRVMNCRRAVIAGEVVRPSSVNPRRFETVAESQQVHGHWLPAQCVLESSQARFVVDVDLVQHTTPAKFERDMERWRQAAVAGDLRSLALPVTWSRLWVVKDSPRVVHAERLTERCTLQVTRVTVLPLSQQPGRRGQRAVTAKTQVVPSDLLRAALDAAQLHGVLRTAAGTQHPGDVGLLQARPRPVDPASVRTVREPHTLEKLRLVRDVHQAAPHGDKLPAVMQRLRCDRRKAERLVRESQERLQWGLAHERSKSTKQRNKGGKT
jgi:hypothetical protein